MQDQSFKQLNDALNVEDGEMMDEEENQLPMLSENRDVSDIDREQDAMEDYEKTRQTYHYLLNKGQEALENILKEAKANGGKPRDYEVFSGVMKSVNDVGKNLIDLQKQMDEQKQNKKEETPAQQNNTQNNYYGMTTKEVMENLEEEDDNNANKK